MPRCSIAAARTCGARSTRTEEGQRTCREFTRRHLNLLQNPGPDELLLTVPKLRVPPLPPAVEADELLHAVGGSFYRPSAGRNRALPDFASPKRAIIAWPSRPVRNSANCPASSRLAAGRFPRATTRIE